jgi:hypothetical protein
MEIVDTSGAGGHCDLGEIERCLRRPRRMRLLLMKVNDVNIFLLVTLSTVNAVNIFDC